MKAGKISSLEIIKKKAGDHDSRRRMDRSRSVHNLADLFPKSLPTKNVTVVAMVTATSVRQK
ncbi:MAG TPA: hypothetical protein VJI33_02165 [Candidatus Paceibacterota bacterium]